jgi:hypothetical protein
MLCGNRYETAMIESIGKKTIFSFLKRPKFLEPSFLIIGCQKCGTTSLYNYLIQHPNVAAAKKKEIHFFDFHYGHGYEWYKKHFPAPNGSKDNKRLITGEATPYYVFHPHVPSRAKESLPNIKLILLLRDPVERAFSHYKYHVKLNIEPLSFEEAVKTETERTAGEWEKMLRDGRYQSYNLQMYSYLARGVYFSQLERWFAHFPREQILLLKSEELFNNPERVFSDAVHFLDLPDHRLESYKKFNPSKIDSIPISTQQYLRNYFRPHNYRLYELIGRDLAWPA